MIICHQSPDTAFHNSLANNTSLVMGQCQRRILQMLFIMISMAWYLSHSRWRWEHPMKCSITINCPKVSLCFRENCRWQEPVTHCKGCSGFWDCSLLNHNTGFLEQVIFRLGRVILNDVRRTYGISKQNSCIFGLRVGCYRKKWCPYSSKVAWLRNMKVQYRFLDLAA